VARLQNKLLVDQTKSRPRHSNDNGLAESRNGSVIRKHIAVRPHRLSARGSVRSVFSPVLHRYLAAAPQHP
jgi:hypothetical protein